MNSSDDEEPSATSEMKPEEQPVNTQGFQQPASEVGPAMKGLSWVCSAEGVGGGKVRTQPESEKRRGTLTMGRAKSI